MTSYRNSDPQPPLVAAKLDWDRRRSNRWVSHIRELLPTAEVWRGNCPPSLGTCGSLPVVDSKGAPTPLADFLNSASPARWVRSVIR
ncbi:hypothetical protein [Mesorhizobium sp. M4A.F.Ca.ET.022.05.2.1]|uniref:hypothetical protein n=1 Tax=Mesorhizobium sp. M4A.F.Ca.ET.022.05.2.1 TaxID=2496653 RepID=UPI0016741C4E|nr:hypothetical protein [Mesorhizobium sp. M4A.F.Ca.ET.022.05.2.1]